MEDTQNRNEFNDPINIDSGSQEYGLPEVNFEPIQREEEREHVKPSYQKETSKKEEKKKKSNFVPVLVGTFILVLIFGAGLYYYMYMAPGSDANSNYVPYEPEIPEVVETEEVNPEDFTYAEPTEVSEPSQGSLTIISGRTQRNYIVVGSFFDEDNANDYGNVLASRGIDAKIIQPTKGRRFYKLAVADFDTFDEAAYQIDTYRQTYGDEIWVLKY